MGFGHLYVAASQADVLRVLEAHLGAEGFRPFSMTREEHPVRTRQVHETEWRLYWVSPQIRRWTSVLEHRYYINVTRTRWGYTDELLALALSRELKCEAYRLEVADQAGFWLYARYANGEEIEGKAHQDSAGSRPADRGHPRYALNEICEREGFANLGLGYEEIPGPQVNTIETIPQDPEGIEGLSGFVHRAFRHPAPRLVED